MDKGWIKLHRSIMDHWVYENYEMQHYWIDLLLMVNHKRSKISVHKRLVVIEAGQRLTSYRQLAERWHMSSNTVKKVLETFQNDGMITVESKYNGTLLTVLNYRVYQGFYKEERYANRDADRDTDRDALRDTVRDADRDADCIQTRMIKNDNNDLRMTQEKKEPASPIFDSGGFIVED